MGSAMAPNSASDIDMNAAARLEIVQQRHDVAVHADGKVIVSVDRGHGSARLVAMGRIALTRKISDRVVRV